VGLPVTETNAVFAAVTAVPDVAPSKSSLIRVATGPAPLYVEYGG
jgi:hypothetical protein